jgi:uncharacterized peroxidase-related enzyme
MRGGSAIDGGTAQQSRHAGAGRLYGAALIALNLGGRVGCPSVSGLKWREISRWRRASEPAFAFVQRGLQARGKLRRRGVGRRTAKSKGDAPGPARLADAEDDIAITALALPAAPLTPAMQTCFDKCVEKLGFVPNVLKAYAFDMAKLEAFVAMYNDLMLAPCGLTKLEREMIAVAVSSHNRCYYCLVAHGAAVRALSGDPALGELMVMNYRAARLGRRQRAMLDFAVKLTAEPWAMEEGDRQALREAGFSDRDIWDITAVTGFFNMSNRVAAATDMRPNRAYHGQGR